MNIAIKNNQGNIEIVKNLNDAINYADYGFIIINVPYEDIVAKDFDDDCKFNINKYNKRKLNFDINVKINELKHKLSSTDYEAIKFAEGELTASEYERTKNYRKQWRATINELEKTLKN